MPTRLRLFVMLLFAFSASYFSLLVAVLVCGEVYFALTASYFSLLAQGEFLTAVFRLVGDHSFLCLSIRKKAKNKTP